MLKNIKDWVLKLKAQFQKRIRNLERSPRLAIIQVGEVEASNRYIRNKVKDCQEIGIEANVYHFNDNIPEGELIDEICVIQEHYDGIIVQLPLPPHIRSKEVLKVIDPSRDVDGFRADSKFKPATPKGIMDYLRECDFDFEGKDVVIIGRSDIVGKPLARMMTDANATVTLCHSKSNVWKHVRQADLIVCAVGKANFLNCWSIHVPVIDVGINFTEDGKLVGDAYNIED